MDPDNHRTPQRSGFLWPIMVPSNPQTAGALVEGKRYFSPRTNYAKTVYFMWSWKENRTFVPRQVPRRVIQSAMIDWASETGPSRREPCGSQGPIVRREKESIEKGARQQGKKETLTQGAFNFYVTNPEAYFTAAS